MVEEDGRRHRNGFLTLFLPFVLLYVILLQIVDTSGHCVRTPMLKHVESLFGMKDIDLYLKLENMQITGQYRSLAW